MRELLPARDVEIVINIVCETLDVTPEQITDDAKFADDLGADSLDFVEITMAVEERLGVSVSDEQAEQTKTVGDLFALIAELRHCR